MAENEGWRKYLKWLVERQDKVDRVYKTESFKKWERENFPNDSKKMDMLPDPAETSVKVLAESRLGEIVLQRIETEAGQFIRVRNEAGELLMLTRDV